MICPFGLFFNYRPSATSLFILYNKHKLETKRFASLCHDSGVCQLIAFLFGQKNLVGIYFTQGCRDINHLIDITD